MRVKILNYLFYILLLLIETNLCASLKRLKSLPILTTKKPRLEHANVLIEIILPQNELRNLNFVPQNESVNSFEILSFEFFEINPIVLFHIIQNSQKDRKCSKFLLKLPTIQSEKIESLKQKEGIKISNESNYMLISTERGLDFLFCTIWPDLSFKKTIDRSSLNFARCPSAIEADQFLHECIGIFRRFSIKGETNKEKLTKVVQDDDASKKLLQIMKRNIKTNYTWLLYTIDLDFCFKNKNGNSILFELLQSKECLVELSSLVCENIISFCTNKYSSQVVLRIIDIAQKKKESFYEGRKFTILKTLLSEIELHLLPFIYNPHSLNIIKVLVKVEHDYSNFALTNFEFLIKTYSGTEFLRELIRNKINVALKNHILRTYESLIFTDNGQYILSRCCDYKTQRYLNIYEHQEKKLSKNMENGNFCEFLRSFQHHLSKEKQSDDAEMVRKCEHYIFELRSKCVENMNTLISHKSGLKLLKSVIHGHISACATICEVLLKELEVNMHDNASMDLLGDIYSSLCSLKNTQGFSMSVQSQKLRQDLQREIRQHFIDILLSSGAVPLRRALFTQKYKDLEFVTSCFIGSMNFVIYEENATRALLEYIRSIISSTRKYFIKTCDGDEILYVLFKSLRGFIDLLSTSEIGVEILSTFAEQKVEFCEIIYNETKLITIPNCVERDRSNLVLNILESLKYWLKNRFTGTENSVRAKKLFLILIDEIIALNPMNIIESRNGVKILKSLLEHPLGSEVGKILRSNSDILKKHDEARCLLELIYEKRR